MNFVDLETYLVLCETLNLTKTAENLYVSQSTITRRLNHLEEELQYKLFVRHRGKKGIELTERGEEFLPIARKWISLNREMELFKHNHVRTVSIAALDSVVTAIIPDVLRTVASESYGVKVNIQTLHSAEIYIMLKERKIDIGFVTSNFLDTDIISREVFRQKYVVIRPCSNPGPIQVIHTSELDPSYEIFTSWGSEYMKWHRQIWPLSTAHYITVDSTTALCGVLYDERCWSIVHMSALKLIQKLISVQVYELSEPPPDWICYEIEHKYPRKQNISGIRSFHEVFENYITEGKLFD